MEQENNEGEKPREGFSCCENDDEKLWELLSAYKACLI